MAQRLLDLSPRLVVYSPLFRLERFFAVLERSIDTLEQLRRGIDVTVGSLGACEKDKGTRRSMRIAKLFRRSNHVLEHRPGLARTAEPR